MRVCFFLLSFARRQVWRKGSVRSVLIILTRQKQTSSRSSFKKKKTAGRSDREKALEEQVQQLQQRLGKLEANRTGQEAVDIQEALQKATELLHSARVKRKKAATGRALGQGQNKKVQR